MSFIVDIGSQPVDTDRYVPHVLPPGIDEPGRVELECSECKSNGQPENVFTVWGGNGVLFTLMVKALVRHEARYHADIDVSR